MKKATNNVANLEIGATVTYLYSNGETEGDLVTGIIVPKLRPSRPGEEGMRQIAVNSEFYKVLCETEFYNTTSLNAYKNCTIKITLLEIEKPNCKWYTSIHLNLLSVLMRLMRKLKI